MPRLFHETLERIELVDQLGFDEVVDRRTPLPRGLVSGINTWMGAVAGRTRHVRIGHANTIFLSQPDYRGGRSATLDILSNGRSISDRHRLPAPGVRRLVGAYQEARERFHESWSLSPAPGRRNGHLSRQIHHVERFCGSAQTGAKKPHPPLYIAVSTPFQRRVCRQPSDSDHWGALPT